MFYGAWRISFWPMCICSASATSIREPSPALRRLRLAHSSSACTRPGISANFTEAISRSADEKPAGRGFPRPGELQLPLVDSRRFGLEYRDLDAARGTRLDRADATDPPRRRCRRHCHGPAVRSAAAVAALERFGSGPFQPAQAADADASIDGRACNRVGNPDDLRLRPALACLCVCLCIW